MPARRRFGLTLQPASAANLEAQVWAGTHKIHPLHQTWFSQWVHSEQAETDSSATAAAEPRRTLAQQPACTKRRKANSACCGTTLKQQVLRSAPTHLAQLDKNQKKREIRASHAISQHGEPYVELRRRLPVGVGLLPLGSSRGLHEPSFKNPRTCWSSWREGP